jgi:hypothetical protein
MPPANPFRGFVRLRAEGAAFTLADHLGAGDDVALRALLEGALNGPSVGERAGDLWDALNHLGLVLVQR